MSKVVKQGYTFDQEHSVAIPDVPTEEILETAAQENQHAQVLRDNAAYKIIVKKAKEEAEVMAQNIVMGAIRQKDSAMQEATQAAEEIKQKAFDEGYNAGRTKGITESMEIINSTIEKTAGILTDISGKLESYFAIYEENATDVVIDIADKVMLARLQKDSDTLLPLIRRAIAEVGTGAGDVTLSISNSLGDLEDVLTRDLPKYVTVKTVDGDLGLCIAESKLGAIDMSIGSQLKKLKKYFKAKNK